MSPCMSFPCPQFLIYASYFAVIAVVFLIAGLHKWRRSRSASEDVVQTGESDSIGDDAPADDAKQSLGSADHLY